MVKLSLKPQLSWENGSRDNLAEPQNNLVGFKNVRNSLTSTVPFPLIGSIESQKYTALFSKSINYSNKFRQNQNEFTPFFVSQGNVIESYTDPNT